MYQKFVANDLVVDNLNKKVSIHFTYDIDEETVNDKSIYICKDNENKLIHCTYNVDGSTITLMLDDVLPVNQKYILYITKNIKSITGDGLKDEVARLFLVESVIDSDIKIIAPSNYEDLDKLHFSWKELEGKNKKLYHSYKIEIATDVNFFNVLIHSEISENLEFTSSELPAAKQYFVRVRTQTSESDFGNWSETITFTHTPKKSVSSNEESIFEQDLEILASMDEGTTPNSFIIEFNSELDPSSIDIDDIMIFRKPV